MNENEGIILMALSILGFVLIIIFMKFYEKSVHPNGQKNGLEKKNDILQMKILAKEMPFLKNYYTGVKFIRINENDGYADFFLT